MSAGSCPVCREPKEKKWHLVCPYCWVKVPDADKEDVYRLYQRARGSEAHILKCRQVVRTLMVVQRDAERARRFPQAQPYKPFNVDLADLEDKWSLETEDEPVCAACGKKVAGEDDDGMAVVPLRLFRKDDGKGLALHPECFNARVKR